MTNQSPDLLAGLTPPMAEIAAYVRPGDAVDRINAAFLMRWPCVDAQNVRELLDIVLPEDRSQVSAALKAVQNGEARSVTCSARLGCDGLHRDARIRLTRDSDPHRRGVVICVEDVGSSVAASSAADDLPTPVARPTRPATRERSYQELRRGAVTAYVRIRQSREDAAIELLTDERYIACRDNGDPDCPPDHVDLYIERHYGMTNPDLAIQELHHNRIASLLNAAGIRHEERGGGIIHGMPIPTEELHPVLDATDGQPHGYTIRAVDLAEIDEKLDLIARALNIPRESLTTPVGDGSLVVRLVHQ